MYYRGDPERKLRELTDEKPTIRPPEVDILPTSGNRGGSGGNDPPKKTGGDGGSDGDEDGSQSSPKTTPKGIPLTNHALGSLRYHGMTLAQVDEVIGNYSCQITQADGATVYIQRQAGRGRKYSIVIVGDEGVVTGMCDLFPKELANLARNYGFSLDL